MYTFPLSKKRSRVKEENENGQNVQLSPWVACSYKAIGMLFLEAWDDSFLWKTCREQSMIVLIHLVHSLIYFVQRCW